MTGTPGPVPSRTGRIRQTRQNSLPSGSAITT